MLSGEVQLPDSVDPGRKNMDALKINELEIETGRQVIWRDIFSEILSSFYPVLCTGGLKPHLRTLILLFSVWAVRALIKIFSILLK